MHTIFLEAPSNNTLFPKQPPHSSQHTILFRIVRVVLRRNLQDRRKCGGVCVESIADFLRDLYPARPISQTPNPHRNWRRTCWLINTMPISFLCINSSNAASILSVPVFTSTTRKFLDAFGGDVTCPTPARRRPVTESYHDVSINRCLISDEAQLTSSPITAIN